MFRPGQINQHDGRPALAWIGWLLMLGAFVWLEVLSQRSYKPDVSVPPPTPGQPFTLVVIDPGHGGKDSGTIKAGILEKDLTLDVAHRLERLVQAQGLATLLTRTDDTYIPLPGRAAVANGQRDCVFISIHFDDASRSVATGIETFYAAHQATNATRVASWLPFLQRASSEPTNLESQSLASFIQEALVTHTHAINRGTRPEQFFVVANVRHPAVLIEGGFLTNKEDVTKLTNDDYREEIARAITDGILRYREVLLQRQTPLVVKLPDR